MSEPSTEDLQTLAEMRLKDAMVLYRNGRHSAAYYLAGYAVECAIKAIISQSFRAGVIPNKSFVNNVYSHNLKSLADLAGLSVELTRAERENVAFRYNWAIASSCNESMRYEVIDPFKAEEMVAAVGHKESGVLSWLKRHW